MQAQTTPRCLQTQSQAGQTSRAAPCSRPHQRHCQRLVGRVAYTRGDAPSFNEVNVSRSIVSTASPPPPPLVDDEAVGEQGRLKEEYQRGFEAGLAAAALQPAQKELIQDSVTRTAAKALTWRILSTATTIGLALFIFKDSIEADAAVELGVVEFISKYGLFFAHERLWALITFIL